MKPFIRLKNRYRIVLTVAKGAGLTDPEVASNAWKIAGAAVDAADEMARSGRDKWCATYQRGLLIGK